MLRLFQSIFGGGEAPGRYPDALVEAAIERVVDGTDARLRTLPRHRRLLRESVTHAIDHVVALVDGLPAPLPVDRKGYGGDARLSTLFASAERMLAMFAGDPTVEAVREARPTVGEQVTALLLVERVEKRVMGTQIEGDMLRREVAQTAVDFRGHRLVDAAFSEEETRRQLKRRAFDHLISLALQRVAESRNERADLGRQRALLRRKLETLQTSGWGFETTAAAEQPDVLQAALEETERQLSKLGADDRSLYAHLDIVAGLLAEAERQLWSEPVDLFLDRMNIQLDATDPRARQVQMPELHNARGRRLIALPVSFRLDDLPPRDDFFTAAQRILG